MTKSARFDFIVVGGGAAGAVLAARLSEDPSKSVLLLEAGQAFRPTDAPELVRNAFAAGSPELLWDDSATHIPNTPIELRARVLGGGSSINAGVFMRALPSDFARWTARGLAGWSYDDVLPYFKKLETDDDGDPSLHEHSGPVHVRRWDYSELSPSHAAFIETAKSLGFPEVDDFNGGEHFGVGRYPMNIAKDGTRLGTALAYLTDEVWSCDNLTIRGETLVDTVRFARSRATGVRLVGGEEIDAGTVILAAGTIGSGAILLRSGIGPAADLKKLGINLVADLPVGQNYMQQPASGVVHATTPEKVGATEPPVSALLFARSTVNPDGPPDIHIVPSHITVLEGTLSKPGTVISLSLAVPRPADDSRGRLTLVSREPMMPPKIELGLLRNPRDLEKLADTAELARRIISSQPFSDYVGEELSPGPQVATRDQLNKARHSILGHRHI
jgi:choline dehydrogenase